MAAADAKTAPATKTGGPTVALHTGALMPLLGLGTWKSKPGQVKAAVKAALEAGYRHIDCAHVYGNEAEIGDAFTEVFAEGKIRRQDVFVTSKLWNTFHEAKDVKPALQTTLSNLKLDYLDLYLIHWPQAYARGDSLFPKNADGTTAYSTAQPTDTWPALEQCVTDGLTRHIGVSNFNSQQLEQVLKAATIKPAVNQIECHPYLQQDQLLTFCRQRGIVVTGYSPLGSPDRPWAKPTDPSLLQEAKIVAIGQKYGKSSAQVLVRFQVQRGVVCIPKSVTPARIVQNFDVFNFELSAADMAAIKPFNRDWRACGMSGDVNHPLYPFKLAF